MSTKAPADAILVEDANLLFNGDFKRAGTDLVITKDDHELVLGDYFKGEKRAALASPDGAYLTGKIVDALTGHVQVAQAAGGGAAAVKIIGHVTKLSGEATVVRNGVSIILNNGDNVFQGDVVQCGSNSTLGITFIDGSVFGLGSNARMVLNEMVYDPNGSNNSSLMSLVQGTISFVAGATAKHGDMKVDTPVATMGIRGTAVLVEIDFDVTVPGSAPPARFQVLVEPDGTTGSYVLLDRVTLAPIATVNQAGTVTTVSGQGTVSFLASAQLSPEAMKLISEVFSQRFTDNTNPKSDTHFTDTVIPQNTFPVKFAGGETGTATITVTNAQDKSGGPTVNAPGSKNHIAGAPLVATFDQHVAEKTALTGSSLIDNTSGQVNYADPNEGDVPTVSTAFDHFTFHNAAGQDVTASLTTAQRAAIAAVSVPLVVTQDPAGKNFGSATWNYNVHDHALDFLAAGETLTLTYMARVDNNFALNNEFAFKSFTITVTGTNDKPTIVVEQTNAAGDVIEDSNVNESGNITTNGTVTFNDVDLTDKHTATFVLKSSDASADLPGFDEGVGPDAAHIGTFALVPISEVAGDGDTTGSLGWTFTLDDDDPVLQSLAAGQTITQVYTITVSDGHGGTVTQDVTITITGSNDSPNHAPVIVGELTTAEGAVTEDTNVDDSNNVSADGTIVFKDIDLIDKHTASFVPKSSTSDAHLPGFDDNADYIGDFALTPVSENNKDTNPIGSVGWTFTLDDDDPFLQSLAKGQTITQVYTVTISDGHDGGTVTQDVTVTITGVNDIPVVYTTDNSFFERSNATGSTDEDSTGGTISFTDVDLIDTHDVTIKSVKATGETSGVPDDPTMLKWLSLGTLTDSTGGGTGSINWTFTAKDYYFDYLADGEDLVVTYTIEVDDHNGGLVDKQVTVTVHGTNDAPDLAADTSGLNGTGLHSITERTGVTNDATADTASGSLTFSDVDLSDSHSVSKSAPVFNWTNSYGKTLSASQINGLAEASTFALTLHQSNGTGHGSIDFSYSAKDYYFDFLADGETLTITYDVTVEDEHHVTSTKPVTITVTGTNDAPVAAADVDTGHIVEAGHDANNNVVAGVSTTNGNVLGNDTDVDVTDTHNVVGVATGTATGVLSGNVGTTIKGTYGWLNLKSDGTWTYTLDNDDPDTNALPQGAHVADVFSYTETDHHGGTATATLTINITGTNDKPVAAADVNQGPAIVEKGVGPGNTPVAGVATANGNVLSNDYDVDTGDTKTVQSVGHDATTSAVAGGQTGTQIAGTYGTLTIHADGTWSYALNNDSAATQALTVGQHVSDVFSYTMHDTLGSTSSSTLTIGVTGTNDAPTVTAALTAGANEGDGTFSRDLLNGASDVDAGETESLSIANVSYKIDNGNASTTAPAGVSISGHTLNVNPANPAFDHLAEGVKEVITVSYDVKDVHGATVHQTETITITGTNDTPSIVGDVDPLAHAVMVVNPLSPNVEPAGQNTNTLGLNTEDFDDRAEGSASNNGTGAGNFYSAALGAQFSASGHAGVVHGSSSVTAAPYMGPLPGGADTTNYLSIGAGATETITFNSAKNAFGLYWGSVDSYNTIKFYDAGGALVASYTGADISPLLSNGNQGSFGANGYVEFAGLPFFTKVVLGSSSNAFEIDNISAGVVPAVHATVGNVSGTMSVHDVDIGDTLTGVVSSKASVLYNNSPNLPNGVNLSNLNDLIKAGNISFDSVTSDGGTDVLHWSYDPHGANLDFLKAGDVLKLIYTAQVDDGHGAVGNQQLVITLVGTDNETNLASFKFVDGTSGNDTFTNIGDGATVSGHGGHDTFVFKSALVSATITDFDSVSDTITFPSTMFNHNPTNVLNATTNDAHGNAVITVSATDTITLQGVDKAHLNASDFHFV